MGDVGDGVGDVTIDRDRLRMDSPLNEGLEG